MSYRYIEQVIDPKLDGRRGVDYGATARVLVVKGNMRLMWRGGATYWSCYYGKQYGPASLDVDDGARCTIPVGGGAPGGRLSRKLLQQRKRHIDERFGEGTTDAIDIRRTLVIEP